MWGSFYKHINKFVNISQAEFEKIQHFFEIHSCPKKEMLLEAGQKCNTNFFVLKGCLHLYYTNDKGKEKTIHFAIENWWITDEQAYLNQSRSDGNIQAIEETTYLSIGYEKQEKMLAKFPFMERYFRLVYQTSYGASHRKMRYLFDLSKEDIYFNFVTQFPEFAQRVPQYLIASYLGLTPEYVSEIRNKKRS